MNAIAEDKVEDLLACLETDSLHIRESLSRLNELRSLVIKRDDVALGKLLESIQAESDRHRSQERSRQSIRKDLANALGYGVEQMTLSMLEETLPKTKSERVSRMKAELKSLIDALRKEYLSTVLLLSECSRLNGMILKSIFNLGRAGEVYYNANGVTKRQTETAFVNLQF
ncbi:MAG: hypothetical protein JSW66_01665 [Phycisphaerales bacterium]|nr:MAG: hypothetical protein JSW66_01665 [Phycisphaerales bacterium]